ncbi:MAG: DUF3536 domain-containing protein [Candidatus Binataceae bacterium]
MAEPRYVIIHGHFYQPPRESPWTGLITTEPSAAPFSNWNERILSECYLANARAHTMEGTIVHIRNNYESIDFNVGPTLFSWLEAHGKSAYRAILRGDALSSERRGGHGNAIAQSYNHSILPLLSERDRALQIAWGVVDFRYRFGRQPDGMWLPECAVDEGTLESLADGGMKFTILAPEQGRYSDDGASARAAGPFAWHSGDRAVAVFRFDRGLSTEISFGNVLSDGSALAGRIAEATLALQPGEALLLATDGETFGHHRKSGAAELARALIMLERRDDLIITNCAQYLAMRGVRGEFTAKGATSWSCPHGVERWRSNCGCRMDPHTSQEWRAQLYDAMHFVNDHVTSVYDRFAPEVVADPRVVAHQGIRLLIDSNPAIHEEFFKRHKIDDEDKRERVFWLLEMLRAGQASLTSCAWFFDDFGGLEGRVALRWAARAVELAGELEPSVEADLLHRLRHIRSNRRDVGDGATLYLSLKTREARGRV